MMAKQDNTRNESANKVEAVQRKITKRRERKHTVRRMLEDAGKTDEKSYYE